MANNPGSTKRIQIDKANTTMVVALAISCFIVVFSLVAGRALLNQRAYQARVISKKEKARDQLNANLDASNTLINSYKGFIGSSQNVIGGNPNGNGPNDGDNAKIILDALPSKYDFPALATSLDKLLTQQGGLKINSITGSDDQLAQQNNKSSSTPIAVPMPFEINVSGNYTTVKNLVSIFERSIRPFQVTALNFSGSDSSLTVDMKAQTFYQPGKNVTITTEVVK